MQFGYDTTSKNSIFDDVDFLCGSNSASYPTLQKTRNVYQEYQRIATLIWECDGSWQFDSTNRNDTPTATVTMGNASASYTVPTTALRIEGVEVKDNDGDWWKLKPVDYADLTESPEEYMSTAGLPYYYDLVGNEIRLFPPPASGDVTLTNGLLVRLSRNVSAFASAATTSPGFAEPFHRILSYAAAIDFEEDPKKREFLILQKERLEKGLVRFYSKRDVQSGTRIKPWTKKRYRQYI